MKAIIYPYKTNNHGFYVQRTEPKETIENVTRKQLMQMADLRHPVLTESEYYQVLSTDGKGIGLGEFELLGSTFLIVVKK